MVAPVMVALPEIMALSVMVAPLTVALCWIVAFPLRSVSVTMACSVTDVLSVMTE